MQTTRRLTSGAILIAVLALFAAACSSSDSEGATTTTKKETTTTEADGTDADETTDTVSDEDFDAAVQEISDEVTATDGDTCGLLDVLMGMDDVELPDPSTPAQVQTSLELFAQIFGDIADAAPAEQAAEAEAIRNGIVNFQTAAETNDYDPEWFNSDEADPFADQAFSDALDTYYTMASTACTPDTSTTVAG